jgi:hypothetical protein
MAGGRPLLYEDAKSMELDINKYFEDCEVKGRPYTMSGLAYALDVDRKTILNYGNKEEFFPTVNKARAKCELYAEESLYTGRNVAGVIFNLKNNYDWKDRQEVQMDATLHTSKLDDLIEQSK